MVDIRVIKYNLNINDKRYREYSMSTPATDGKYSISWGGKANR